VSLRWLPGIEIAKHYPRALVNLYSFFLPGEGFSPEFTDILHEASYARVSVLLFFFSTQISWHVKYTPTCSMM
jgi:hypothetical protein